MLALRFASMTVCGTALLCACDGRPSSSDTLDAPVVAGNPEPTRHPAMGYLVMRINRGAHAGEIWRPNCGATLIRPNVIVTAAHCVVKSSDADHDVVAAGFGDGHTGATYGVVGKWQDWVAAEYLVVRPDMPFPVNDYRRDVAIIELERPVTDIAPMPVNTKPIPNGAPGLLIGYGRVVPDNHDKGDNLENRPDHRDRFPGLRKSVDLTVVMDRATIEAAPRTVAGRAAGTNCFGDSGGTLILEDGSVAGTLMRGSTDFDETDLSGVTDCAVGTGAAFASFRFPPNAEFIAKRLAEIGGAR